MVISGAKPQGYEIVLKILGKNNAKSAKNVFPHLPHHGMGTIGESFDIKSLTIHSKVFGGNPYKTRIT
jgi:hypothetical protein